MRRLLKVCIVCYNNEPSVIQHTIQCILDQQMDIEVVIVDHSPKSSLANIIQKYSNHSVKYFFRGEINNGYGGGNNFGFKQGDESEYFLILNPDVYLNQKTVSKLISTLKKNDSIGIVVPKILNENGSVQKLMKGYPSVAALLSRRFPFLLRFQSFRKSLSNYEMSNFDYNLSSNVKIVSGCFMLIRSDDFQDLGGFDERFFLYFEDYDLCMKMNLTNKIIFYQEDASIIHLWNRGAHKSLKHFYLFFNSMICFFNKWSWKWF